MLKSSKSFTLLSLLFLLVTVGCSENPEDSTTEPTISKEDCVANTTWSFTSIQNIEGISVKTVSPNDVMSLTNAKKENFFYYHLIEEDIFASGNWEVSGDTLIYTYDPKPEFISYDSVMHETIKGAIYCTYFKGDSVVAQINISDIDRKTRKYLMTNCDENTLVMTENGISYAFSKK